MPGRGADTAINNVALTYNNYKVYSTNNNKIIVTPASFFSTSNSNYYINNNVVTFTSLGVDNTGNMFSTHWASNSGYVTKYNNANQVYCQKIDATISGNGNSFAYIANMDVVVPYNNNVYIGGRILNANLPANYISGNLVFEQNSYPLIAKLDANSNTIQWAKYLVSENGARQYFSYGWGTILKICIDSNSGSIYAMTDTGSGQGSSSPIGTLSLGTTIVKFDNSGNLLWQKTIMYVVPNDLKLFDNGDILVIGTGYPPGVSYAWIRTFYAGRFDGSTGDPIWQRFLKDNLENWYYAGFAGDITTDQQYYYITGYKGNLTGSNSWNSGTILKMPANGQIIGNGLYSLPTWNPGNIRYYNAANVCTVYDPNYTPYNANLSFTSQTANYGTTNATVTTNTSTSFRFYKKI